VSLEASALTGAGHLLDRLDAHDLILQGSAQEVIDDLVFLDRHGEQVDLLQLVDLAGLYKAAQLGARVPGLGALVGTATAAAATTTVTATTTALAAEATLETTTTRLSRHD
jgi:hypothetical protein